MYWRRVLAVNHRDFQIADVLLMLPNSSIRRIVSSLVVAVWLVCPALGRLTRGFLPGDAGWFSTEIVVAQETEKPGLFQVIDVWKGSLSPGDLVRIPGMADWQRSDKRVADDTGKSFITITSHQVLLCLKRDSIATDAKQIVWTPATLWDTWKTSFAWLQDGKQYVYGRSTFGMGPEALQQMAQTENQLKDEILKAAYEHDRFDEALAIADPSERAYAVSQFFKSRNPAAVFAASKEVVQIGPNALPALRAALQNPDFLPNHGEIILSMGRVGRAASGPDLASYLDRDRAYWAARMRRLVPGWWNDTSHVHAHNPDRDHYGADVYVLDVLRQIRFQPAVGSVERFCQVASTMPSADRNRDNDQLAQKCRETLQVLHMQ